jgi:hypothetical protein
MRKGISVVLVSFALSVMAPMAVMAAQTPQPSSTKQSLTQVQRKAISAARLNYAMAKSDALNGFDRALADAKAIQDQAIVIAGSDQVAVRIEKKNYKQSYKTILHAYKADLNLAKVTLLNAIAAAKANK